MSFEANQPIPKKFTGDGENISPSLQFMGVPQGAKSLAVVVDDPDAPGGVFDHWIMWNVSSEKLIWEEGFHLPTQGTNGFGTQKYGGPRPPKGALHHYHFKLYALDQMLDLPKGSRKAQLEAAMEGHILSKAELIGTYAR